MSESKYAKYLYNDFIIKGTQWKNLDGEPFKLVPNRLAFDGMNHWAPDGFCLS